MAGYILGRMQYAPTWVRSTSMDKKYQLCRRPGTYWGVCNTPLLGYDQFLLIKNITHANCWIYTGAYAIRPYWVTTNFYLSRILSMQITGYMQGRMQYAPTG